MRELDELAAEYGAVVSVWMGTLDGRAWVERDAAVVHHPASTVKLALVVALHRAAEAGELGLDDEVLVTDRLASVVPGQTYLTTQDYDQDDAVWDRLGRTATLGWLGERAIVASSNLATNLLVDRLGVDAVNAVYADLGAVSSRLARGIQDGPGADLGWENTATAADLAAVLRAIADRTAASRGGCERIEAVLARCEDNAGIPAGLPPGTYVAHKPGWIEHVCHDVGIVRPEGEAPWVLAILTRAPLAEDEGFRLVAEVAGACWNGRADSGTTPAPSNSPGYLASGCS